MKTGRIAALVFALAVVVRLAFIAWLPGWDLSERQLSGDAPDYHHIAANLADGKGYAWTWPGTGPLHGKLRPTAFRAPLWPAALSVLYRITGPSPFAGRLLVVGLDGLACALLVLLGTRLRGPPTGVLAGVFAALYPPLVLNNATVNSEAIFGILVVAVLLVAERFRRRPAVASAAALGILLGLAALGRPNGLVLTLALAAWAVWTARTEGFRRAAVLGAACLAGAALLVVPWVVRTAVRVHTVVPVTTQSGSVLGGEFASSLLDRGSIGWGGWDGSIAIGALLRADDEASFNRDLSKTGTTWIEDHPGGAAKIVGYHVLRYFDLYWEMRGRQQTGTPTVWRGANATAVISWWLVAIVGALGVVRLARERGRQNLRRWGPALVTFLAFAVSGVLFSYATRYRAPAEPVVLLLAAVALTRADTDPAPASS